MRSLSLLGWIGTAVTGSATSAGALFGNLQATAAQSANLPPQLLLGVNEVGGGIGKIISPQNLAIAASAVKSEGSESEILRRRCRTRSPSLSCWVRSPSSPPTESSDSSSF